MDGEEQEMCKRLRYDGRGLTQSNLITCVMACSGANDTIAKLIRP
jgi:hypothetical protein